jgi:apolipoprotein N-acyltransferase
MQELLPGEASESAEGQGPDALPGLRLSRTRLRVPLALSVALISGAAGSLALPPANLGWVAFLAPIPLLWLVREARPRRGVVLGLAFGVAYFGATLYWILLFGELAWAALVLMAAAGVAVFGALAPVLWRPSHPIRSSLGLAALWTLVEWIRGAFPLGGFTWGALGSTQTGNPWLLKLASVGGMWSISFVVLLASALLLVAFETGRGRPWRSAVLLMVAAAIAFAPGLIVLPSPNGRPIDVAAIQVDVSRAARPDPVAEDLAVARMNIRAHRALSTDPPDLAVWGEGALDPGASSDPPTLAAVRSAIASVGAPTLIGAVTDGPDGAERTEALLFDGSGALVDRYAKVHLVPFGEYVPWRDELGWLSAIRQIPVDRTPGEGPHTVSVAGLPPFGTPICYENSFPSIDRAFANQGATFLVVTINNASYERTAASRQHLLMSRVLAVEDGRWVVHAAISGISAIVDPSGRVVAQSGLFADAVTRRSIVASTRRTWYVRLGDWVPWLSLAAVIVLITAPRRRRRPQRSPAPLPDRPRTLVLLPTYDERATVGAVMDGLLALPELVDVLVIDDGSPDGTGALVRARARGEPRLRLLERASKSGLASAYLVGFQRALAEGYDLVVEMDADLSHDPAELPRLIAAASGRDLVIGSRYVPGGSVTNWSRRRVVLSRAGNRYARWSLGLPIRDATSGFRVFRSELLERILADPIRSDGYGFQIELAYRAWTEGSDVGEVPITFREREHGASKISRRIVVEALWLVTVWGIRARLSSPPPDRGERR